MASNAGTGTVHLWLLSTFAANGNSFTGSTHTCGMSWPDIVLNSLGHVATGGSKEQIQIPATTWAMPAMPAYPSTAAQSGWGPPSSFQTDPTVSFFGLRAPSDTDAGTFAWPSSSWAFPVGTTFPDDDGDGNPGITATPLDGNGYAYPPTGLGISGSEPSVNLIYYALRTDLALSGTWTSCMDLSGNATVTEFDDHVIGCHISGDGGAGCTSGAMNTQADFVDQSRVIYAPGASTFTAKVLATGAACSDVLSALP